MLDKLCLKRLVLAHLCKSFNEGLSERLFIIMVLVSRLINAQIHIKNKTWRKVCFHTARRLYTIPGPQENKYGHQKTQTEIPSHHQSSMAKDQMRVHADSSIGLRLLSCLSTIL